MPVKWLTFRIILYINILFSFAAIIELTSIVFAFHREIGWAYITIFVGLLLFIFSSANRLIILAKKYPAGTIRQITEGIVYVSVIFSFIACLFLCIYDSAIIAGLIERKVFQVGLTNYGVMLVTLVANCVLLVIINIYTGVLSLHLLTVIGKNRLKILREIHSFGSQQHE